MLIDSIRFRVRRSNPIDSDQIIPSISHIIIAHFNRSRVIFQRLILGLFGKTEPVFFCRLNGLSFRSSSQCALIDGASEEESKEFCAVHELGSHREPRPLKIGRLRLHKSCESERKIDGLASLFCFVLFCFLPSFTEFEKTGPPWLRSAAIIASPLWPSVGSAFFFSFFFAGGIHRLLGSVSTAPHYRWIMCRV